jgi:HTH-type transcriptional repressor of NAD biosynthesis genes
VTRGLIIGKFLPPHAGHRHLVETARRQVDELTVIVFSLQREPIPGPLRQHWLQAMCPGVRVLHAEDENPQEPHEHPAFWDIWIRSIRARMPTGPDVVFTSEGYGDELAHRLGARHVCVDRERQAFPVSGRAVRADPWAHARHLTDDVRSWFVKRVVLTGAESTGKTTLACELAARYGTSWVPEYARQYLDARYASRPAGAPLCALEDMVPIARGQLASEDALARQACRVLFCDTDAGVTRVYSRQYFGVVPPEVEAAAEEPRYALHLLLGVDVPWVADRQRDLPHLRREMHEAFRDDLHRRHRPYVVIDGPWSERVGKAVAAVDALLAAG